jgi:hypothetical protein
MEIKTIQKFQAADGTEFLTKEAAVAHNLAGPRIAAVQKAIDDGTLNVGAFNGEEDLGFKALDLVELPKFLAANADQLLVLLAKPVQKRAPKTPAAPAA